LIVIWETWLETEKFTLHDPLEFIQNCLRNRQMLWTCHVNMRVEEILSKVDQDVELEIVRYAA